jgi:hypothetical protein
VIVVVDGGDEGDGVVSLAVIEAVVVSLLVGAGVA